MSVSGCTYVRAHTHKHTHTHTHTHTRTHSLTHPLTYIHVFDQMLPDAGLFECTQTHTRTYTHTHAHIHTDTHSFTNTHSFDQMLPDAGLFDSIVSGLSASLGKPQRGADLANQSTDLTFCFPERFVRT